MYISSCGTRRTYSDCGNDVQPLYAYRAQMIVIWTYSSLGSIINTGWLERKGIESGGLCIAQGVIKHISDVGTALWTMIIAGHTFLLLFLEVEAGPRILYATLIGGWSAIGAIVISGPASHQRSKDTSFYGISGYWCWISPEYSIQRITLDYMILRGNLVRSGWRIRFQRVGCSTAAARRGHGGVSDISIATAKHMLLYPVGHMIYKRLMRALTAFKVAYTVIILPIGASRIAEWTGHVVPFEVTIFSATIFLLSGLVNVVLIISTRRILPVGSIAAWHFSGGRVLQSYTGEPSLVQRSEMSPDMEHGLKRTGTFASHMSSNSSTPLQKRMEGKRPPDIIVSIERDSITSIYGLYPDHTIIPPISSHWSPDTPPLRQLRR
ncbi:hypothetical protein BDQ12DRAFT_741354 [Crucibulum laeve]|uniref:Glucose receptor Git3 N-terminal domain-containing protein n=1 Tax=Crucibulum laeve TaxID=68775 RepID=A0A5C3MJB3_9AGAR|nr:hypothetical protein BDQ12DRAFT_741354 [Crucibulum laeve]